VGVKRAYPDAANAFERLLFHSMTIASGGFGLRASGAGIARFYTKTGVGTLIAESKEPKEFNEGNILECVICAETQLGLEN
jgi:acyl CoA:acetate/3-ketoacid CoA transferase alpha subunit